MKIRFALALSLSLSLFSSAAFSAFTSLVVLGDSLSDSGNGALITGGVAPGTPTGRASNGLVAVEYLAATLGITDFRPSGLGGTNYAVFGATTGTKNFSYEMNTPTGSSSFPALANTGLQSQLTQFSQSGPFDPAKTLFTVWGGANDIFLANALGGDLNLAANNAVANLMGVVGGLLGLGAQNILVVGLPDLSLSPLAIDLGPATQAGFAALTAGFNGGLSGLLSQTEQASGANLMFFDPGVVTRAIVDDPQAFGLTNITEQCILSPQALQSNCEGYAFLDDVHPTTVVHSLFAAGMAAVVPEPTGTWIITLCALAWVSLRNRARRNQA